MKKFWLILLLFVILTSCSKINTQPEDTPTPQPPTINTPEPTPTPPPLLEEDNLIYNL